MASVNLRRLITSKTETYEMFQNMMNLSPERIGIYDQKGNIILGTEISDPEIQIDIELGSGILGKVTGGEHAKVFAGFLKHYVNKENERKTLGQELLTMYREINVIYDFSDKLAETIDPQAIADLALKEANALIKGDGGIVLINSDKSSDIPQLIAHSGHSFFTNEDLATALSPYATFSKVESAEIVNNTSQDERFNYFYPDISSILFAPLKVKHSQLGIMAILNKENSNYAAADLKLLTTLALQAASAIESANQYKKNIEEAKSREEVLKRVDKLKDEFLANTSHELRTPLNGIIGLSESLFDNIQDKDFKEDLSMIISSGKRLASLVNDLLDFSKLKNFDIELNKRPVDLKTLTDIILRINNPLIKGKTIILENKIHADFPAAVGDENRLEQILNNLIANAIKFTESGIISIDAEKKGEQIIVKVSDTGIGIPKNKIHIIFQEFQQADGSISREFAGTGLGLSISKKLVELHGGDMWVESKVGKGSDFYFSLPATSEKVEIKINEPLISRVGFESDEKSESNSNDSPLNNDINSIPSLNSNGQEINILIVDDEPINHRVLKNHLSSQSFRITQAMNGMEALKALENGIIYNLVILDVMMPKMTGYEVCQKIREKFMPSELPVIMVTAKNQVQDLVQGLNLGANDYLAKPFTKQEFLARIQTQLDLQKIFEVSGRFVPNEFIKSLGKDRITDVQLGDQVHKDVTVMFTDIRGYTTLAENMTPEDNFKFINAFNSRLGPIVQRNKGFINQYLGDGIMALYPNKPEDALLASIQIQEEIRLYNASRKKKKRSHINIGIGLHTGSLVMGITGDLQRLDAAIISDTVNTASRIENLSKYFGVNIILSEDGLKSIVDQSSFHLRYLGMVIVKGKNNSLKIYECFNGDKPETIRRKIEMLDKFNESMEAYFNKKLENAIEGFDLILKKNPDDRTARLFHERASDFLNNGLPKDWEGIEIIPSV